MITVSVPGKVHLMGEHAVVYGKPAILAAINKRLTVTVHEGENTSTGYVRDVIAIVQKHFRAAQSCTVTVDSKIPTGFHLGSSAAVAAGVVGAVSYFLKKVWNPTLINQLAYEAEKLQHGNPSGGDNTTVVAGGFVWYRKEFEFLKSIWQLPFTTKLNHFFLIDTGKPVETTGEMVAFVAKQSALQDFCTENEIQTKRIALALKENDERALMDAMQKGERSLECIGVVSEKAKNMVREIEREGAAAKILGGGGREEGVGYLLCYTRKPKNNYIPILLGEEGIRLESKL